MRKALLLSAIALAFATQAPAQTALDGNTAQTPVQEAKLPNLPTVLELRSLDSSWRRFTVRNSDNTLSRMYGSWGPQYEQVMNDLGIGVYFTTGSNISIGQESYLVAYRVDPGLEPQDLQTEIQQRMQAFWGHVQQQAPPRPTGKFAPDAKLKLSLLNLRNIGDLESLRAFNPKTDLLATKDLRELSNFNLQRLGQLLTQYARHQELPLRDANQMRQMLRNRHAAVSLLRNPADNTSYRLNTSLAGKRPEIVTNRKAVVVAYEAAPSSDNTRGVLFLDWRVERVPEWKWKTVRAVQPKGPTAMEYDAISAKQMQQIFILMTRWARSRQHLPALTDSNTMQRTLMSSYGWNPRLYLEPRTRQGYRFNQALSNMDPAIITNKSEIVAVYEPVLAEDGKRGAIFLNGVVRRVDDAQWKAVINTKPRLK